VRESGEEERVKQKEERSGRRGRRVSGARGEGRGRGRERERAPACSVRVCGGKCEAQHSLQKAVNPNNKGRGSRLPVWDSQTERGRILAMDRLFAIVSK
jgi:hypothetical protein